jgi:hypothetical protein
VKRDYSDYLNDIINEVSNVESFTEGMSFNGFFADYLCVGWHGQPQVVRGKNTKSTDKLRLLVPHSNARLGA